MIAPHGGLLLAVGEVRVTMPPHKTSSRQREDYKHHRTRWVNGRMWPIEELAAGELRT